MTDVAKVVNDLKVNSIEHTESVESDSSYEESLLHIEIISQFPLNELDEIEDYYISESTNKLVSKSNTNSSR